MENISGDNISHTLQGAGNKQPLAPDLWSGWSQRLCGTSAQSGLSSCSLNGNLSLPHSCKWGPSTAEFQMLFSTCFPILIAAGSSTPPIPPHLFDLSDSVCLDFSEIWLWLTCDICKERHVATLTLKLVKLSLCVKMLLNLCTFSSKG